MFKNKHNETTTLKNKFCCARKAQLFHMSCMNLIDINMGTICRPANI
jgi:hypothetical protein